MELTMQMPTDVEELPALADRAAGWSDVVAELTRSSAARAAAGALWQRPGAVGVLSGAAPVVWVHGATDIEELLDTLADAPRVYETYVATDRPGIIAALQTTGWTAAELMVQLVCDDLPVVEVAPDLPAFTLLGPTDLPDMRELLRAHGGADDDVLENAYGDDFFIAAAPVWVLGARAGDGRLVAMVAVRRQARAAMGFALVVADDWRSRGLARAAVAAGLAQAFAVGAEFVHVQAGSDSRELLVACGFTDVGSWQRMVRSGR
jgi:N-acetylglutamate synthase-like GNAT family acetyltransferase